MRNNIALIVCCAIMLNIGIHAAEESEKQKKINTYYCAVATVIGIYILAEGLLYAFDTPPCPKGTAKRNLPAPRAGKIATSIASTHHYGRQRFNGANN